MFGFDTEPVQPDLRLMETNLATEGGRVGVDDQVVLAAPGQENGRHVDGRLLHQGGGELLRRHDVDVVDPDAAVGRRRQRQHKVLQDHEIAVAVGLFDDGAATRVGRTERHGHRRLIHLAVL